MSQLTELPTELLIKIFDDLDLRNLLHCKPVCRLFNSIINDAATLQYKMELALCGMEDGPPGSMVPAERLECLREHQDAWGHLRFTQTSNIDMQSGNVWELYGNVLSQGKNRRSLAFHQLASVIRGIEDRSWSLDDLDVEIRDFGMDPAQNLLVLIESLVPNNGRSYSIHLRTLSTGESHPAAPKPAVLTYTPNFRCSSFTIQTSAELLGIIFHSMDGMDNELIIWNWKTTEIELAVSGDPVKAFAFLTDHHILLAKLVTYSATLAVVDLQTSHAELTPCEDLQVECEFYLPELLTRNIVVDILLRLDPGPNWTPNPDLKVPFHIARGDRLFVVTVSLFSPGDQHLRAYTLFIPSTTIFKHMDMYSGDIEWEQWGPAGSRLIYPTPSISRVWVCYVYGMGFTFLLRSQMHEQRQTLYMFDFNQLAIRKSMQEKANIDEPQTSESWNLMTDDSVIDAGASVFNDSIKTSLPFRFRIHDIAPDPDGRAVAAMLSEDSIILVCDATSVRRYRILTF
ncbi:unnamed protein product [Somion occarium]|uniref:F-box domain-containing protein n=1 Tax=Somion occarium TaxID=3059160 RepID=A0ABP1CLU7_9APHY